MTKFAQRTAVPVDQSKGDIRAIVGRYGGQVLDINEDVAGRTIIMIGSSHATPRYLRISLSLPVGPGGEQTRRRKWRALFNDIKFKFVSIDEGIETFDQAFMAWIIGENGKTLYEIARHRRLLPPPEKVEAA